MQKFFLFNIILSGLFIVGFADIQEINGAGITLEYIKKDLGRDARNYQHYLSGSVDYMTGKYDSAILKFEKLKKSESCIYFYDNYIRFLFTTSQFDAIVKLPIKIKRAFKGNLEIEKIFAQSYFYMGKGQNSAAFLNKLIKQHPNDIQLLYFKAVGLIKNSKLDEALTFINSCLKNENLQSKYFLFYFLISKIYLQKEQTPEALKFVNKSLELFPDFDKGLLLRSILQEQLGQIKDAVFGYQRFLAIVGADEPVEKQLIRLLFMSKRFDEAVVILEKIKNKTPAQSFDLALIKWHSGKNDAAFKLIEGLIKSNPKFNDAKLLKIEMLIAQRKFKDALDSLNCWLQDEPENKQLIQVLLLLRHNGIKVKNIINILQDVEKKSSNELILSALIDLNFEKEDTKGTLFYCKKLFDVTKDSALKSKILFQTAYIHFSNRNYNNVENILLTALKYEPVYPSNYNLLAYFYAQMNKKLDDALKYADLALKYQPTSYYYMDTKGYVLFKMGQIGESEKIFEIALGINPNDKVVKEHLDLAKAFGH